MLKSDIRLGMRVRAIAPVDGCRDAVGLCGEVVLIPAPFRSYDLLVKFDQKRDNFHFGGEGYHDPTCCCYFGHANEFVAIDESEMVETEISFDDLWRTSDGITKI